MATAPISSNMGPVGLQYPAPPPVPPELEAAVILDTPPVVTPPDVLTAVVDTIPVAVEPASLSFESEQLTNTRLTPATHPSTLDMVTSVDQSTGERSLPVD